MEKSVREILEIWDTSLPSRALPTALETLARNHAVKRIAVWAPSHDTAPGKRLEALDIFDAHRSQHVSHIRIEREAALPLLSPSLVEPRCHQLATRVADRLFGMSGPGSEGDSFLVEIPILRSPQGATILVLESSALHPWSPQEVKILLSPSRLVGRMVASLALAAEHEELLRKKQLENEFLEQVQDIVKFGAWEFDVDSCMVFGSPETAAILGLSGSLGPCSLWKFFELVHPDDRSRIEREVEFLVGARSTQKSEFRIVRPDGSLRFVEIRGRLHWHHIATEDRVFGVMLDVTDRRAAELLRSEREASKMVETARATFLANMSHELRTPLHAIVSYSRFGLERSRDNPEPRLHSYFDEIYASATQLMDLLTNLLDLARLETGRLDFTFETHSLSLIARETWSEWEAAFQEKGLQSSVSGVDLEITCDRTRMMQCLRNLLSNAWKFSQRNTEVVLHWELTGERQDWVLISLTNRGVGIPDVELERVFERFQQSSRTQGSTPGSGLGLAICREIIEGHKGRIWAENTPDGATRFCFTIPVSGQGPEGGKNDDA